MFKLCLSLIKAVISSPSPENPYSKFVLFQSLENLDGINVSPSSVL